MQSQHQLAVILFTDIVGYTALMQKDEQKALATLQKFKLLIETKSEEHEGRIVQYFGDGCLLSFSIVPIFWLLASVRSSKLPQEFFRSSNAGHRCLSGLRWQRP